MSRRRSRRPAREKSAQPASERAPATLRAGRRAELWLLLLVGVLFLPTLSGEFVYDDLTLIVKNPAIQRSELYGQALGGDLFAVLAGPEDSWSDYWRPTFVLWLILGYALFGLQTVGWHACALLFHLLACWLLYRLCLRLAIPREPSWLLAMIFAVHPVHVESVAWISGSVDALLAVFLLTCLHGLLRLARGELSGRWWLPCLAAYALALGCKEIALVFPLVAGLVVAGADPGELRIRKGLQVLLACLAVACAYWLLRWAVLGSFLPEARWQDGRGGLLADLPQVLWFYLRQALLPIWLGPSYPLRPAATIDVIGVLLCLAGLAGLLVWSWKRRAAALVGVALCSLLLPAFNTAGFYPERMVHDRYLYLPLAGMLLCIVPPLWRFLSARGRGLAWATMACLCLALAVQTGTYSRAWQDNLSLWLRAVESDPSSGINWSKAGRYLLAAGRREEARRALDTAIALGRVSDAYIARAQLAIDESRWQDAEADLRAVLQQFPGKLAAWERLALCYQSAGRSDDAAQALRQAREAVPHRRASLTTNLASVLYAAGRKQEALDELRAVESAARSEPTAGAVLARYWQGVIAAELGEREEARQALSDFIVRAAGRGEGRVRAALQAAKEQLQELP